MGFLNSWVNDFYFYYCALERTPMLPMVTSQPVKCGLWKHFLRVLKWIKIIVWY